MPRATNAPASRERRRRRLKKASGFYGSRSKLFRQATEAVNRSMRLATIHRKQKKRDDRSLWITRITAACKLNGMTYSRFIEGLRKASIGLNRKMISEIAIADPQGFATLIAAAKGAIA